VTTFRTKGQHVMKRNPWGAIAAILVACAFGLAAGCAGVGSSGHGAGRTDTELRGVLVLPATNAVAGVVAVLQSRSGTRASCNLLTSDADVAADIRAFAAKGAVVIVAGEPGADGFAVTAVWAEGKPRRKGHAGETNVEEKSTGVWPNISWGGVPTGEK
jgi:hypothetical protein